VGANEIKGEDEHTMLVFRDKEANHWSFRIEHGKGSTSGPTCRPALRRLKKWERGGPNDMEAPGNKKLLKRGEEGLKGDHNHYAESKDPDGLEGIAIVET